MGDLWVVTNWYHMEDGELKLNKYVISESMFNLSDDNNKKKIERDKHTNVICDLRVHYNYVNGR